MKSRPKTSFLPRLLDFEFGIKENGISSSTLKFPAISVIPLFSTEGSKTKSTSSKSTSAVKIISKPGFALAEFLKLYYNSGSYFLVSPGNHYSADGSGSVYVFQQPKLIHKICIAIVQLWCVIALLLYELYTSHDSVLWKLKEGPQFDNYFRLFLDVIWTLMMIDLFRTFWQHNHGLSNVLNRVQKIQKFLQQVGISPPNSNLIKTLPKTSILLVLIWGLFGNIVITNGIYEPQSARKLLWNQLCRILNSPNMGDESCGAENSNVSATVLKDADVESNKLQGQFNLSIGHTVFAIFIFLGGLITEIAAYFSIVSAQIHSITLYFLVRDFKRFLLRCQRDKKVNQEKQTALTIFEEICGLCWVMDEIIGTTVAFTCVDILTYFAGIITDIPEFGVVIVIQICLYASVQGTFLFLAAETHSKIGYFTFWLQNSCQQNHEGEDWGFVDVGRRWETQERVTLALFQMQRNHVGVRGRFFTVTYSFVSAMLGLLLSYTILISQFKASL